jgi:hypothetical protein
LRPGPARRTEAVSWRKPGQGTSFPAMEITRTFYARSRGEWRAWLEAHYRSEREIWLVQYKKSTGRPGVSYADTVEEALCFGWIDSTRKSLDGERHAQRFTPRRPGSGYSRPNLERLRVLLEADLVAPDVVPAARAALAVPFVPPDDVLSVLRADPEGWRFFCSCSDPYQRIRLAFVDEARDQAEEFERRLRNLRKMNAVGKRFGYGIERFY